MSRLSMVNSLVLSNGKKFLLSDENKLELLISLVQMWGSSRYAERPYGVQLFVCHRQLCSLLTSEYASAVLASSVPALSSDHEEADSRIFLHAKHASNGGFACVVISSPDTDVAVIGIHHANAINASFYGSLAQRYDAVSFILVKLLLI